VTTIIENAPDQAWLTRGLLHHADFAVTERHYNHARQIEAARRWAALLDNLAGGPK